MSPYLILASSLMEYFIIFDFINAFLKRRSSFASTIRCIFITCLISLLYFFVNLLNHSLLNLISFPLFLFIYVTIIFDSSIRSRLLYILFSCCIFFGCEFLFAILLEIPAVLVNNSGVIDISKMPWHLFTLKLLTYFICNLFKLFSSKSSVHMEKQLFLSYLIIPFASLGIMFLTYYSGIDFRDNKKSQTILCIFFALMQIGNMFIFYAFQRYSNELLKNAQQRILLTEQNMKLEYYSQIEALHNQNREFIHNVKNHIKSIGFLIQHNQNHEALDVINELNIEIKKSHNIIYSSNNILNSILLDKKSISEKCNIDMDIFVEPGVSFHSVSTLDLISILGNLLDNAIEATSQCENNRRIKVRIYMEQGGHICVTKITNPFCGILSKQGEDFLTTKADKTMHGIGLKSVKKIVKKYGGILDIQTENQYFTTILIIS